MDQIKCIGRDGQNRSFYYEMSYENLDRKWQVRVYDSPTPSPGEFFEFSFEPLNDHTWRQVGIYHHEDSRYRAMGIPDAMLPRIKADRGVQIVSSPTEGRSVVGRDGVWRTEAATKMWERLCSKGLATYNGASDTYQLT